MVWEQDLSTKAKSTQYNYRTNFKRFLDRYELTAEELYEMRREDQKADDPRDGNNVERMVKVLMAEMTEEGYKPATCRNAAKAVSSFFESQGMPLKLRAKDKPKGAFNGSRLALAEQIRTMYDYAPTRSKRRTRAVLLFLKDSGLRISDLAALDVSDYLEAKRVDQDGETFVVFFAFETVKMKVPAFIHIGPEAVEGLDLYLEERSDARPEDPLFLNERGERYFPANIGQLIERLGSRKGMKKMGAHSLRKFHTTMLESGGLHSNWVKKLQGKAVMGSMGPYSLPEESGELTPAYIQAYDKLRVFRIPDLQIEEQKDRIGVLEETVKKLVQQNIELKGLQTLESNASMRIAKAIEDMSPEKLEKFLLIIESFNK